MIVQQEGFPGWNLSNQGITFDCVPKPDLAGVTSTNLSSSDAIHFVKTRQRQSRSGTHVFNTDFAYIVSLLPPP
jgi:hypothetical protein